MDYASYYPNTKAPSSSSIIPIVIPSSHLRTHTSRITRNGKNKGNKYNNNSSNNCSNTTNNSSNNNSNNNSSNSNNNNNSNKGRVRLSTDPQSVAARERRHRISERFRILQSLIPGGAKLDTVSLLDHAIHYVNFLKAQIWLHHQTIFNHTNHNNRTLVYHNDDDDSNNSTTMVNNNDASYYDYDQYCYALMLYNKNNSSNHYYVSDHQQGPGFDEGNFPAAWNWNHSAQIPDLWGHTHQQNDVRCVDYNL